MIGIVVVSHSRPLAKAAVELASEMVPEAARPQIRIAAGLDDTTFGTDAAAIAEAITAVDTAQGVLILTDVGSSVLSAEMALEFVDEPVAARTTICPAPLVEGLIAAVVTASTGADRANVAAEANAGLVAKQEQLGQPVTTVTADTPVEAEEGPALEFETVITNEHGLHARPAATLVAGLRGLDAKIQITNGTKGRGPAPASSLAGITALGIRSGDVLRARITGPDADQALAKLKSLAAERFGENDQVDPMADLPADLEPTAEGQTGRQVAVGPAQHLATKVDVSSYRPGDKATERSRLDQAVGAVLVRLQAQGQSKDEHAAIFAAQAVLLEDPELTRTLHAGIAEGATAVDIVQQDFTALADELSGLDDPYLRERAQDIRSLARQICAELVGVNFSATDVEGILIVDELDPLVASSLDATRCLGIITCTGGATGHGVIIAGARGIPVVTGIQDAKEIPNRTTVALDPVHQRLWVNPTMAELAEIEALSVERKNEALLAAELCHQPAVTRQGQRILVEANIASLTDAKIARQSGADGSGLVRTEVLFSDWDHAPTADEQAQVFLKIAQALDSKMLTIRTWDPGGDKPLAFLPQAGEVNPMLGERGIRAMRRLPELLREQLKAVALTSKRTPIRVMFPMVTEVSEIRWATDLLKQVLVETGGGHVAVGMMIETPAAAVRAADFVPYIDFVSIGTNDLTQYVLAADRGNAAVDYLTSGELAAVWDLIRHTTSVFADRPVAVCGNMASEPDLVQRLIEAGVTELSVRPPLVGIIKLAVRTRT